MKGKVYFVGAGPGDPELITVKGRRLLAEADLIIYAGSLIPEELLRGVSAQTYDSSRMKLEEIVALMARAVKAGQTVVRLHSGDPAYYGALHEQMVRLRALGIPYEIVPGVTSASAGAARLGVELTVPEVSQTVIFTRLGGRTPGPDTEELARLAAEDRTLVIFLSISRAREIQEALLQTLSPETPVAIVARATWPEEKILRGKLSELTRLVTEAGLQRTALIYVGRVLEAQEKHPEVRSKLYGGA